MASAGRTENEKVWCTGVPSQTLITQPCKICSTRHVTTS